MTTNYKLCLISHNLYLHAIAIHKYIQFNLSSIKLSVIVALKTCISIY